MAEQQAPVLVDEEDKQQETFSVKEEIDAGELVNPAQKGTVEDLPTERGVPRLDITPIRIQPKPEANVPTKVDISLSKTPVTFKSLQPEVEASISRQEEPDLTYDQVLEKLDAGETVNIQGPTKTVKYSGPMGAKLARTPAIKKRIETQLAVEKSLKKQQKEERMPTEPVIPFVSPTGKIDVSYLEPDVRDIAAEYAAGRKALDDTLRPLINTGRSDIDVVVRQYFVDEFTTGNFLDNLSQRLAESGRAVPTLPAYAVNYAGSAAEALFAANDKGTSFSEEWAALAPKREQNTKDILRDIDAVLPAPLAAMAMNDDIHKRAKEELSPEQYEEFAFTIADDGKTKIKRQFVDEETAYAVLEEAFGQMNLIEQLNVLILENLGTGGLLAKTKNANAAREVDRVITTAKRMGVDDGLSITAKAAEIRRVNDKAKINDKLLDLGIYNRALSQERSDAADRIVDLTKELDGLALSQGKQSLPYRRVEAEIANLRRMRRRTYINTKISPYMRQVVGAEVGLATAALAGRELFGFFGMDAGTGEFAGAMTAVGFEALGLGKKVRGGTTTLLRGTIGLAPAGAARLSSFLGRDGMLNPISLGMRKLMQMDTTVDDYERLYYMPNNNGKRMSYNERKMVSATFKQIDKMDPDQRNILLDNLQAQADVQNQLLKMFPEGPVRDEAARFLNLSVAEASGIPQAMAAYDMAAEMAITKGVKKQGLGAMIDSAMEVDAKISRAQFLVDSFRKHAAQYGDPAQAEAVTMLLQQTQNSLLNIQEMMDLRLSRLNKDLDDMYRSSIEDITEPLEETFLEDYIQVKEYLSGKLSPESTEKFEGAVSGVLDANQAMLQTEKSILKRFENVKQMRDNKLLHQQSLESAVEALIFQRHGKLSAEMDKAYDNFRDFVATTDRPSVDLSSAVERMLDIANENDITAFFGPQATFFNGYLGRKSRKMFDRMVRRTLSELPDDERAEMFTSIVENGVDPEDLQNLIDTNPTQFGLMLHQSGKLNVFARANIEEAEEFLRAFRDYGYKTANKSVARQYYEFKDVIDEAMEASDKEGFEQLKKARGIYQQLNDPNRPGTPLNRILGSKVGDKVTPDDSMLVGMYKGKTPFQVVGEMGDSVVKLMSGRNKVKAKSDLTDQMNAMVQLFGTPDPNTGKMVIDLRTEEGMVAFELMEEVIDGIVFDAFSADFLSRRPTVGSRIGDPRGLGFRMTIQDELADISDIFNIDVLDLNGQPDKRLVYDMASSIAMEQDIAKEVMKGGKRYAQGRKAVGDLKRELGAVSDELKIKQNTQRQAMQSLEKLANIKQPSDFYMDYVRGYKDIDILRTQFVETMKMDPDLSSKSPDEILQIFDEAIYNLTFQGLMEVGGRGVISKAATSELKGLLGEGVVRHGFSNALDLVAELEGSSNPNVRKNLERIMPSDQIDTLKSIAEYLSMQETAGAAMSLRVGKQGMTANEAISRAYNIARGMVSPSYVATEVALRMLQKSNHDALLLAMQSKDAATIIEKLLRYPESVTKKELDVFDTMLKNFLFNQVARAGQEEFLTNYMNTYLEVVEEQTNDEQEEQNP